MTSLANPLPKKQLQKWEKIVKRQQVKDWTLTKIIQQIEKCLFKKIYLNLSKNDESL